MDRWFVVLSTTFFAGAASAQVVAGRQAEKIPLSSNKWTFFLGAYGYPGSSDSAYGSAALSADRRSLHLEARYNYENLRTGSLWTGYNFVAGHELVFRVTPMFGVVVGRTTGIAPGYELSFTYKRLELYSEGEYVRSTKNKQDNFSYSWNELRYSPVNWLHFGLVDQGSKAHRTEFEGQHGVSLGFSRRNIDYTTYTFITGSGGSSVVLALSYTF
ncbi:MAG TPA: hypothetical protein VGK64_03205 [Bryobacteraceae bacterium]